MASPANKQIWLLRLGLALGVLLAFGPVIHYEFTTYDDPTYVTANPPVQGGVTCQALAWAFTTGHGSNWHPLTWISHMLDCQVFGLNPGGHHLSSLLLHLLNTVLLFTLLQRLTGATWRSALVAALFAWHPLHVESVAWVAERKDVLSATFWLLTLLAYVQYVEGPQPKRYLLTLVLFALGLLSKPMVVTLPFVLLLLDYWPLGRSGARGADKPAVPWSRLAWEKVPFFILAAVSSVVTLGVQKAGGAVATLDDLPFRERSANALLAYGFYLRKVFWPTDLAVFYPLPTALSSWQVIAAGLLLLAVTIAVVICRQSRPYLVVGWFWFLGTLVPVIGLVQVGLQAAADRYTYLPLIGIFILLVWGVADLASRWPQRRLILGGLTTVILGTCLVLTWLQVRTWKNGITLFTHALAVTSNRFVGHNNLARALGNLGRYDEAAVHLKAALEIQPGAPLPLYHLGLIAAREGKLREAMDRYQAALVSQPDYAPAQFELANILASQGNLKEAALHYQACLRTEPDRTEVHHNLAKVLAQLGALSESVDEFKAVLRLDSNQPEAHDELAGVLQKLGHPDAARLHYTEDVLLNPELAHAQLKLGLLLAQQAQFEDAKVHLMKALQLEPDNDVAYYNLAAVFAAQGRLEDAAAAFTQVVRLKPADADAHARLAAVLSQGGRANAALAEFREALRLKPDWPEPMRGLAAILSSNPKAELRNGAEAVRLAERASELTGHRDPRILAALDQAYAEAGRFPEAIQTAEQVQQLATSLKLKVLVEQAGRRLELYRAGKPYRE